MTLRRHITCLCFLALAFPSVPQPVAFSQTTPGAATFSTSHPSPPLSPEMQGDLLAARQRYLDAIKAYSAAPKDSAIVANKMGVAYHHMFDIVDAKKQYERAIALNPRYAEAINNLGAIYHAEKNYKQAERHYRSAIKLEPNSALFYSNLGTAYFFGRNVKKGAEAYTRAFAIDPDVFERGSAARIEETSSTKDLAAVNYTLAKTYARAGNNERALAYLRKALGEGFRDRRRLMGDEELSSVRETPRVRPTHVQRADPVSTPHLSE